METFEAIRNRASLKMCLSGREVEKEKILKVLEAGRLGRLPAGTSSRGG